MAYEVSERERNVRERLLAGSGDLKNYIELADIAFEAGRRDESLTILTKALDLDLSPLDQGTLLNEIAQLSSLGSGKTEEAFALAEQALSILKPLPGTRQKTLAETSAESLVAQILSDTNRARAIQIATHALATIQGAVDHNQIADPEDLCGMYGTASRLCALLGKMEEAIAWARRALVVPVGEFDRLGSLVGLGRVLKQAGRNEDAKKIFVDALDHATKRPSQGALVHYELGLVERSLGCPTEARVQFQTALQIVERDVFLSSDRDYMKAITQEIATSCYEIGDHRMEAATYRKLLGSLSEDDPDYLTFKLSLTGCEIELRCFEEARKNLESILESKTSTKVSDAVRGGLLSARYAVAFHDYEIRDYQISIKQLESLLTESIEDDKLRSDILLLLGHACFESKRFLRAQACYDELINSVAASQYHRDAATASIARLPESPFKHGAFDKPDPQKRVN